MQLMLFLLLLLTSSLELSLAARTVTVTSTTGSCGPSFSPYVTVYTTTNSGGSIVVTTSTVDSSPPPTPYVTTYTTTDSAGDTIITISTFTPYVTVYTSTDSSGATHLTTSTVTRLPAQDYVSVYTTTNSAGSTITTSTTITPGTSTSSSGAGSSSGSSSATGSGLTSGTSSASAAGTSSGEASSSGSATSGSTSTSTSEAAGSSASSPCPQAALAQNFQSSAGIAWQIFCSAEVYFYDLPAVTTDSFVECINACDEYKPSGSYNYPCVAVTWQEADGSNNSNCLLKYGVEQVLYGASSYCSAKLASYALPPDLPVSIVSSYATQATAASATTSLTYATGTAVTSYQAPSPCPLMNGSTYTVPDGADISYEVLCGYTLQYDDLPNINVGSLQDCMAACNDYVPAAPGDPYDQPCIAITYIGQNPNEGSCFRHYAINKNYVIGGSPYGDSAVRKNSESTMQRKRNLQHRWDLLGPNGRLEARNGLSFEVLEARAKLAAQGIDLVLAM